MCKSLWPDITAKREETPKDISAAASKFLIGKYKWENRRKYRDF